MIKSTTLDKVAISLSAICLVHCLLAPVLLTLLPIFTASVLVEDWLFHQLMLWVIIPTSTTALVIGCRKHRFFSIALSGAVGMAVLISVALYGHQLFGHIGEKVAVSLGGLILAFSHFLNFRACQTVSCDDANCSSEHHH